MRLGVGGQNPTNIFHITDRELSPCWYGLCRHPTRGTAVIYKEFDTALFFELVESSVNSRDAVEGVSRAVGLRLETSFPWSGPNDRSMPRTSTEKSYTADGCGQM